MENPQPSSATPTPPPVPANPQRKTPIISIVLGIAIILAIIITAVMYFTRPRETGPSPDPQTQNPSTQNNPTQPLEAQWSFNGTEWQVIGAPPACPEPVLASPVNLDNVTSILYPGQPRGGLYKSHGGFRFDNAPDNLANVTVPLDAKVFRGSRYLVNGETQYTFDFIAPCGVMYRLGHLLTLTDSFQQLAEKFPQAQENDSKTYPIDPPVAVNKDELVATQVGVRADKNTFVDFGVYDLRTKNEVSKDPAWSARHGVELDQHAVCWFTFLSEDDQQKIVMLPAGDPTNGAKSDYCK